MCDKEKQPEYSAVVCVNAPEHCGSGTSPICYHRLQTYPNEKYLTHVNSFLISELV